jgi:hypothetical protein
MIVQKGMLVKLLPLLLATAIVSGGSPPPAPPAQSDLDAFMARVLARRDDNWTKMQQYILDEDEHLHITGPDGSRLYGFDREYIWFIRDSYFIRSPLNVDGVAIPEADRARYEARFVEREKSRERRAARAKADPDSPDARTDVTASGEGPQMDVVSGSLEPRFVSAAYFLRFKFDPGHYALAGREQLNGRDVLKIEYYPSKLFTEGRSRPNRRVRERDDQIEEKMNKVSLVTLWIDPTLHQILRYTFDNMGLDFLPGRSIVRIDEMKATMEMTQPFPDVWLPGTVEMGFGMSTALGALRARYDVSYHDYRLAEVTTKVRPPQ